MKNGKLIILLIAVILIAACGGTVYGISQNQDLMHLGLDLQGGISVTIAAIPDEGKEITQEDMDDLLQVMQKRVDEFGVAEPVIQQDGDDRIIIELAGVEDTETAMNMLGSTAKLEFKGPDGNVFLSGDDLKNATSGQSQYNSTGVVYLEFTDEGAKKFGDATTQFVGKNLDIYLDGELIESATVQEPITDGNAEINRIPSYDEAAELASLLRSGALPVDVDIIEMQVVGPQLGADSLHSSYIAILYGIIAIFVFMIVFYRWPGVLACLSLLLYALIIFWLQSFINVTLTLAGIAAFLLSVGMAVDANVIIFERIRDELRKGKTLSAAVHAGFKRAFSAVLDANVTTLIATVVLYYFGQASVRGFAITLALGIISSMFTAIVFTRFLLNLSVKDRTLSKKALYRQ